MSEGERLCACGCGRSLAGRRTEARYATDACRARAWKARVGYSRERRLGTHGNGSSGRARRRSPRPGLSVYLKDPDDWRGVREELEEATSMFGDRTEARLRPIIDVIDSALARHRAKQP